MAKILISVDFDLESDDSMDDVSSKFESFLSEKIEEYNHLTEEDGEGSTIYDFQITEVCEDDDNDFNDEEDD